MRWFCEALAGRCTSHCLFLATSLADSKGYRWTAQEAAPSWPQLGDSDIDKPQHWLQSVDAQFSPCLFEELDQLAQLKKQNSLEAESLIPPGLPLISGSVNTEVVLLKEESLKGVWLQETFSMSCRCSRVEIYHLYHCSLKGVGWTELEHRFSAAKGQV